MTTNAPNKTQPEATASAEYFEAAINHVDQSIQAGSIAESAAKGILFSLIETLGTLVGDPDLPSHARSGYEALLGTARELHSSLKQ